MKTQLIFAAMVVIGLLLSGCGDPEEKARALYNEAMVEQRDGNVEQARSLYEKIIEKYPTTEIAVKINESLVFQDAMAEAADGIKKEIIKKAIITGLQLYKLDNGKYPTTEQGVQALIARPSVDPIPRRWRQEGYMENPESLLLVESYIYYPDDKSFDLEMK